MKIIKPSVEFFGAVPTDYAGTLAFIEKAGRTCYRSEDKITDTSAEKFVKGLIDRGHLAMVEHSNFVVRLRVDVWSNPVNFLSLQGELGKYLNVHLANNTLCIGGSLTAWMQRYDDYKDDEQPMDDSLFTPFFDAYGELFGRFNEGYNSQWEVCPHDEIPKELHRYSAKFICDRGISHELVRHRPCSFAQECLSGDTEVRKGLTIRQLYERGKTSFGKTHNKTIRLRSSNNKGNIIPNKMAAVWKKGVAPIFKLTTKLGYQIKATKNHEFQTENGEFIRLMNLNIGSKVMVNGRPSLLSIPDKVLLQEYIHSSPSEISEKYGAPHATVRRRLHQLGAFIKRKNDKDLGKYNKNHTKESYEKMRSTIAKQYDEGREPWNKGLTEDHPSVKIQADTLRRQHYNNKSEADNSNWKGGVSTKYYIKKKNNVANCELCGESGIHVHHIDENRKNNEDNNLVKVCQNCHDKLHHGWYVGISTHSDIVVSIEENGVEEVFDIEMSAPFHNFIANGFVVHNSTRYVNYGGKDMEFIEPAGFESWSAFNRQGFEVACSHAAGYYNDMLDHGLKPQQARAVLPNALKTEIIVTADAAEWAHIRKLRTHPTAHPDMVRVMNLMPWEDFV